jgi:hypothetical protein
MTKRSAAAHSTALLLHKTLPGISAGETIDVQGAYTLKMRMPGKAENNPNQKSI